MGNIIRRLKLEDGTTENQLASVNDSGELSTTNTALTNKTQFTKVTDGTNDLSVGSDGSLDVNLRDESGTAFGIGNPLYTHSVAEVSTDNSTSTPLGVSGVFTGTGEDILDESVLIVSLYSDVASATDGLSVQFSTDNTNWDHADVYTIPAATGKTFTFQPVARYMRIVYTNGVLAQTEFRLQVLKKSTYIKPSSHRIQDSISTDDDAELVKSVLTGEDVIGGTFRNVLVTPDGNLQISNSSDGLSIAEGLVVGTTFTHKFGDAPDFDISDGDVTIWDGANDAGTDQMVYQYSATADIDSIVSSNAGDTQDIEISGLDTNYDLLTQTVTLNGQTRVALGTSLIRVFRMINRGSTDLAGDCSVYVNSSITAGVVDDSTKVRAIINNGNNQTLMAVYTIPNGKKGYMRNWFASLAAKKTAIATIRLVARPIGEVFQLKHIGDINSAGSSNLQHNYIEPEVFDAKTDIEMRASTSVDANGVAAGFDLVLVDD